MKKVYYYYTRITGAEEKCIVELDDAKINELRKEVLESLDEESSLSEHENMISISASAESNVAYCMAVRKYLNPFLK